MKGKARAKKEIWFKKVRGSYLPTSWQGIAVYFIYLTYVVTLPIGWYLDGHELWKFLGIVVPLAIAAALLAQFIASRKSR